jgi:hypothetical protein
MKDRTVKYVQCVCWRGTSGGRGWIKVIRWGYIVDGLHILIWNWAKKPLASALRGVGRGWGGETMGTM